jgi:hypothetical protein
MGQEATFGALIFVIVEPIANKMARQGQYFADFIISTYLQALV